MVGQRNSEELAPVPGGEAGASDRKGHVAREFQRHNRSDAADKALSRPAEETPSRYHLTPRMEEVLAKKKAIHSINLRKRRAPITTAKQSDHSDSSLCSACLDLRTYRQLRRPPPRYRTTQRQRTTKRNINSGQFESNKRAKPSHPQAKLELISPIPSLHAPPPRGEEASKEIDSQASSLHSYNSSDHEPVV